MTIEQKIKYTIIDGYPLFREGVNTYLSEHGFTCIDAFGDLRAAMNSKIAAYPDIIITELVVKHTQMLTVIPELRRRFAGCRVLVYSQYNCGINELQKAGVHGYLQKTEAEELVEAMFAIAGGDTYFKMVPGPGIDPSPKHHYTDDFSVFSTFAPRELEAARLIDQHWSCRKIAREMDIQLATAKTYRRNIKRKMNVKSNKEFYDRLRSYFTYIDAYALQQ